MQVIFVGAFSDKHDILQKSLILQGASIVQLADAQAAMHWMEQHPTADVIVWNLESLQEINSAFISFLQQPQWGHVPLIILSGIALSRKRYAFLRARAQHIVLKPFRIRATVALIMVLANVALAL